LYNLRIYQVQILYNLGIYQVLNEVNVQEF